MSTHEMETTINLPDEEDVDVTIEFRVDSWGRAATPPSWNHPGDPPEGPEYDIISVVRADNGDNITAVFETMTEAQQQKVWDLVVEEIGEIDSDRGYNDDWS